MGSPSFFGRAWKVTVTPQATGELWTVSNSSWSPEALRVTFEIEQVALQRYWFADIAIYNLSASAQQVIQYGDLVTVEAGYQSPGTGLIFQGKVFQPLWEREGDTDYKLTLHCLVGLWEDDHGYVSVNLNNSANPITLSQGVQKVATAAGILCNPNNLDPVLQNTTLPRGSSYAGPATKYFSDAARDHNLNYWMSWTGINIRSLAPQGAVPNVIYAPPLAQASSTDGLTKYTLIGTPQQTEQGVTFRTLLDSSLQLGSLVKIEQAILNKLRLLPGRMIRLDKDGLFVVGGIRYLGDTRGNDWYSEVTGVTRGYSQINGAIAR